MRLPTAQFLMSAVRYLNKHQVVRNIVSVPKSGRDGYLKVNSVFERQVNGMGEWKNKKGRK